MCVNLITDWQSATLRLGQDSVLDFNKARNGGGNGISWIICKSFAYRPRQVTTPVPHHSVFAGRMPFLPLNQQCQSTEALYSALMFKSCEELMVMFHFVKHAL